MRRDNNAVSTLRWRVNPGQSRNGALSTSPRCESSSTSNGCLGPTRLADWFFLVVWGARSAQARLFPLHEDGPRFGRVSGLEQLSRGGRSGWRLLIARARLTVASATPSALSAPPRRSSSRLVRGGGSAGAKYLLASLGIAALLLRPLLLRASFALLKLGLVLLPTLFVAVVVGGALGLTGEQGHGRFECGLYRCGVAGFQEEHGLWVFAETVHQTCPESI